MLEIAHTLGRNVSHKNVSKNVSYHPLGNTQAKPKSSQATGGRLFIENEFKENKLNVFPAWARDTKESRFRGTKLANKMDCSPGVLEFANVIPLIKASISMGGSIGGLMGGSIGGGSDFVIAN